MPRTKKPPTSKPERTRVTRYRELWEASVEREGEWKRHLEEAAANLANEIKRGDQLSHDLVEARGDLIGARLEADRAVRERNHLRGAFDALLQRYVGVKLDCQQLNWPQARNLLDHEWGALDHALEQIRRAPQSMEFVATEREAA